MNYRSLSDLNRTIVANLHRLPDDIDLVVGIPRSGLLAANLFSLVTNIPMTDLDSFLLGRIVSSGTTKRTARLDKPFADLRRILILDDSIHSGTAMRAAREKVAAAGLQHNVLFAAVYGHAVERPEADFVFEQVSLPRIFQWNVMHHVFLGRACMDIDGVLSAAPANARTALAATGTDDALPLHMTTRRLGCLVSARPEGDRGVTEAWLKRHAIDYEDLRMGGTPTLSGARYKARLYRSSGAILFISGTPAQSPVIAWLSGKPVLCVGANRLYKPGRLSLGRMRRKLRRLGNRLVQGSARLFGGLRF